MNVLVIHPKRQKSQSCLSCCKGDHQQLLLVLYARNSDFDRQMRRQISFGNPIYAREDADGNIIAGGIASAPDPDEAHSSSGSPVANNAPTDPASNAASGPTCGQYCWGPSNLCTDQDGCQCIADPWQGVGSAYFTGSCKLAYRASTAASSIGDGRELLDDIGLNATNGRVLLSAGELNSTNESSNATISIEGALAADLTDVACPCNCTYVSNACCRSSDGIVFEAPVLKLGVLKAPNASYMCNTTTGDFQSISAATFNANLTSHDLGE